MRRSIGIVALVAMCAGACGGNGSGPARSVAEDRVTAPVTIRSLLQPFGLQIQRWSMDVRPNSDGVVEMSVYSRPTKQESPSTYGHRFAPLATAVIPELFAKYPEVSWIDLCQEEAGTPAGTWEPLPVTRLEISRNAAASIDWPHATTASLLAHNRSDSATLQIEVHNHVADTPEWKAAAAHSRN
jgi:hypothetical protein